MNIKEIYTMFDRIGSLTFATVKNGYPETRIAHFFSYDDEGLYFRTMFTKPFYKQLKEEGKISVCGLSSSSQVNHNEEGMPEFEPGYTIRITGDVKEVSFDDIKSKTENKHLFKVGIKDKERYPAMKFFVLYKGAGEIFDYDFETKYRNHKLLRTNFSFNSYKNDVFSLKINENCLKCGKCYKVCSFKAIEQESDEYKISQSKCDVCGNCVMVCPVNAIKES